MRTLTTTPFYQRALEFLERHQGEHLAADQHRLLTRCIYNLTEHSNIDFDEARQVTLQAAGELSARNRREYIDLDHCTSYVLVVADSNGMKACYTLDELLRALEHAHAIGTV